MRIRSCSLLITCVVLFGCGREQHDETVDRAPGNNGTSTPAIPVAHAEPADLVDLRLRVEKGDRFPLIKTIEQQLTQQTAAAQASAVTRLQLSLMLEVEQATSEDVLFAVRYTRVHYAHNVNGKHTVYDSAAPTGSTPWDAVPYAGLVGHGYSVRIGADHKVIELIGHDQFLQDCLAQVPIDRRQSLTNEIAVRFGDEGVAGFIPDTFGVLPFDGKAKPDLASRVQEGDSWKIERQLMQPIPVHLKSTCRVVRVTPTTAEIDIAGRVIPGQTYSSQASGVNSSVRILGGTSTGICVVDRPTGLPIDVQRLEMLNVQVVAPDGTQVSQVKRISTTVRLFPTERGRVVRLSNDTGIMPASAQSTTEDSGAITIPTSTE